jgi:hypothetical protein
MPTPRPIIDATWGAKLLMAMKRERTATSDSVTPMPKMAVTIGSPMATAEPKAISRMITAATRPTPSRSPGPSVSAKRTESPPTSTCSPGRAAALAASLMAKITDLGTSVARTSNWTRAKPMRPSREMLWLWSA